MPSMAKGRLEDEPPPGRDGRPAGPPATPVEENFSPPVSSTGSATEDAEARVLVLAIVAHRLRRAGAVLAEGVVEADRDVAHAQALVQHAFGELAVGHTGERRIPRQDIEHVDAQRLGERAGLLVGLHQPERRGSPGRK